MEREQDRTGIRLGKKLAAQFVDIAKDSIGVTTGLRTARMRLNDLFDQLDILDQQIENCGQAMDDMISSLDIGKYLRHRQTNQLKHPQAILAAGLKLMRIMFHVVK